MPLIAEWDGSHLEICDETGARKFVSGPAGAPVPDEHREAPEGSDGATEPLAENARQQDGSALAPGRVDAPLAACLLPAELLLQRPFVLPFENPRYVDADTLAQELADQAGAEEDAWWLCWQAGRVESGVRGLVFALPGELREELSAAPISSPCPYIGPDIAVRLAACLPQEAGPVGVLDADAEGLMLGVYADGVWRGMRRLNQGAGRSVAGIAQEAMASLKAMGFDAARMPLIGRIDAAWQQAFERVAGAGGIRWQVEIPAGDDADAADGLPVRQSANARAVHALGADIPFNFRHGDWAVQTDWGKRIGPWRRSAVLLAALALLLIGQDAWQLHQLQNRQEAARTAIEQAFHQALPGVAMIDPMLQLRQAAGGGVSGDAWKFVRNLEAITQLGRQETAFKPNGINYGGDEVILSGAVADIAAANRARDALASVLGRKVDLLDTDLNDGQVLIRLRWAS